MTTLNKFESQCPNDNTAQREAKEKFYLSKKERAMLEELAEVLKHFEWLTDNLQQMKFQFRVSIRV